ALARNTRQYATVKGQDAFAAWVLLQGMVIVMDPAGLVNHVVVVGVVREEVVEAATVDTLEIVAEEGTADAVHEMAETCHTTHQIQSQIQEVNAGKVVNHAAVEEHVVTTVGVMRGYIVEAVEITAHVVQKETPTPHIMEVNAGKVVNHAAQEEHVVTTVGVMRGYIVEAVEITAHVVQKTPSPQIM
ncbi:unnamed protein product, partial [Meganyctiphanes norvegica]